MGELHAEDALYGGVDAFLGDGAGFEGLEDGVVGFDRGSVVVADEDDVGSGGYGAAGCFAGRVVLGDSAHGDVVGNDDAVIAQFIAQKIGNDGGGQAGGDVVESGIADMSHHDGEVRGRGFGDKGGEGAQILSLQFIARDVDGDRAVVGVGGSFADPGEMFQAEGKVLFPVARGGGAEKRMTVSGSSP